MGEADSFDNREMYPDTDSADTVIPAIDWDAGGMGTESVPLLSP